MDYDFNKNSYLITVFTCLLYEREHVQENHSLSQNMSRRGWQASVQRSVESLRAISPVLAAGLSCQVDQVVKGWRDNTG